MSLKLSSKRATYVLHRFSSTSRIVLVSLNCEKFYGRLCQQLAKNKTFQKYCKSFVL